MKSIKRVSVTKQVVESVKESIISGQFTVGEKLPAEVKLCELLKVSRSSIREAMQALQVEGYVELIPGRGAFVRDNQSHDYNTVRKWFIESVPTLEDYTEVREAIEPLAVRMAIQRSTEEEIQALLDIHQEFIDAEKENNVSLMANLDEKFHTQIIVMAHNVLLSKINSLLASELKKYRVMSISVKEHSDNTIQEHGMICKSIKMRDARLATSAMLKHLEMTLSDMNKVIHDQPVMDQ
jgi:GntR family transcriptional repressor for pyruvate dehydrogenase complex